MENELTYEMLEINKYYKISGRNKNHALKDFSYTFTPGVYGLVGSNGAGKSTLMNIITGYIKMDSGKILINGKEVNPLSKEYKKIIGYMPQQQLLYENMTCEQFLYYMGTLKGLKKKELAEQVQWTLGEVNLLEKKREITESLSGGMKQRLLFAQAIVGDSKFLLLDEPTAGVDPEERNNLKALINNCAKDKIVLLSTHIFEDLEGITKEIIHLSEGRIIFH